MEPSLTWLDFSSADREKMRRVLDLFKEQGTVDEMGLGTLRDTLADALFPGTSTIQTRLRYMLFIPWLYQRLERRCGQMGDLGRAARDAEIELIGPLASGDDAEGVIGSRARVGLSRLPSQVYWAGLVRWGIFQYPQSQSWYHSHFTDLCQRDRGDIRADDPGLVWAKRGTWHPRLPSAPEGFPWEASFSLRREDAEFLRGRIEERCSNTLLAWLAGEGSSAPAENFWEDPSALAAKPEIRATTELARRFSLHVEGLPLLYNLLLAKRRRDQGHRDKEELVEEYLRELGEWASREGTEERFEPAGL
jgi:hypothetical protein